MNCERLLETVRRQLVESMSAKSAAGACRLELPLTEPNGDLVKVYVEEHQHEFVIHDGGHILGLLFETGPAGVALSDKKRMERFVKDWGLDIDRSRGVVFASSSSSSLAYWVLEVAKAVLLAPVVVPTAALPVKRSRRLGPRVAREVVQKLVSEQLNEFVRQSVKVRGTTQIERFVDLSYSIPGGAMRHESQVLVLAVDLDVPDPVSKAYRSIDIVTDLSGLDPEPILRMVHSVGTANGQAAIGRKLIETAARKKLLEHYSWDDPKDQARFVETVRQELGRKPAG